VALIEVVVLGLAVYRAWRLVGQDEITAPFRDRLHGWAYTLVTCPWCLGLHVSVVVSLAWLLWPGWMIYVLYPLAVSTIVGALAHLLDKD
jgi:hypothetical protein